MSHAVVLVVTKPGQSVEELMRPYDEELAVETVTYDGETYSRNPQAKWDWYQVGGRWTGMLVARPGAKTVTGEPGVFGNPAPAGTCDSCLFGDVDWDALRELRRRQFSAEWDGAPAECTLSREEYVRQNEEFRTRAVLMPDGVWHERGRLGWFGVTMDPMTSDQWAAEFTELLSTCQPEWTLTIVDYHI